MDWTLALGIFATDHSTRTKYRSNEQFDIYNEKFSAGQRSSPSKILVHFRPIGKFLFTKTGYPRTLCERCINRIKGIIRSTGMTCTASTPQHKNIWIENRELWVSLT